MSEETLKILRMVQEGKLTPEQGAEFLSALNDNDSGQTTETKDGFNETRWTWQSRSSDPAHSTLSDLQDTLAKMHAEFADGPIPPMPPATPEPSARPKRPAGDAVKS